jgi:apoptosis-stimulating of p53 protein 1
VAAVEPYNHIPSSSMTTSGQHHQQIVQDLAMLKLKAPHDQQHSPSGNLMGSESDELKIARQKKQHEIEVQSTSHVPLMTVSHPASSPSSTTSSSTTNASEVKKIEQWPKMSNQTMPSKLVANSSLNVGNTSLLSHKIISSVLAASNQANSSTTTTKQSECDNEKASENDASSTQIASSTPLNVLNKAIAEPVTEEKPAIKPKALHQIPSGNLVVPPRKPVSSVAPTSITLAPKSISQTPKVQMVAPNNNIQAPVLSTGENDKSRPALPPKPAKSISNGQLLSNENENSNADSNNLPIKAKPLTIKKQPLSEQPKLRSLTSNQKLPQYSTSRRIEMPPSFLFPEIVTVDLKDRDGSDDINGNSTSSSSIISKLMNGNVNLNTINNNGNHDNGSITSADETDKSVTPIQDERPNITDSVVRRKRNLIGENVKAKLARRVSFDPLALLLDASLEGELELVRKTCGQVPNPSAANDEGITALHNAICAGHFEIVK